jgi:hypothetical protein
MFGTRASKTTRLRRLCIGTRVKRSIYSADPLVCLIPVQLRSFKAQMTAPSNDIGGRYRIFQPVSNYLLVIQEPSVRLVLVRLTPAECMNQVLECAGLLAIPFIHQLTPPTLVSRMLTPGIRFDRHCLVSTFATGNAPSNRVPQYQ